MPTPEQIENARVHVFVAEEFHGDQPDILNFELERLDTDPVPATLSRLWYNTTEQAVKTYVLKDAVLTAVSLTTSADVASLDGGTF